VCCGCEVRLDAEGRNRELTCKWGEEDGNQAEEDIRGTHDDLFRSMKSCGDS
jgi:hypothetical protein